MSGKGALRILGIATALIFGTSLMAQQTATLPDAPGSVLQTKPVELASSMSASDWDGPDQQEPASTGTVPLAPSQSQAPTSPEDQQKQKKEQLQKEEHQRILGVMPAFNSVTGGVAAPLTPREKFGLMFKSTTDPYVFGFAAFTAGIGQAQDSHHEYGQGALGYLKRFGAAYADTADGNFWGNAVLPVLLHEDPRYFRKGTGTFKHRLLYSISSTIICRRDNGTIGPNYANVVGNLIAGGISNVYYPAADRGAAQTFQNAATVTAEGTIGAFILEFWPDLVANHNRKKQEKLAAAAGKDTPAKPVQ